jgi:hypothetical protein
MSRNLDIHSSLVTKVYDFEQNAKCVSISLIGIEDLTAIPHNKDTNLFESGAA